jgi:hypothetical protein
MISSRLKFFGSKGTNDGKVINYMRLEIISRVFLHSNFLFNPSPC